MIGRVNLTVDGAEHPLRLSTKAMVSLEAKHDGKPITEILGAIKDNPGITFFAQFFAQVMNDGQGGDLDDAMDIMDQAGGVFAVAGAVSEVIEAAFPDSEDETTGGAKPPAGKIKTARKK